MPKKQPDLHKIADSYVKRFADTFEQSANALPARITMGAVEKDMARGIRAHPKSLYAIIDEVPIIKAPQTQAEQKAQKVYESIIQQVAATQGVVMDLDSPFVLEAAKKLTADLVTNVSKETKAAIRQMIFEAIRDGDAPMEAQKVIRTVVGLTKRDAMTVKRMQALHPDRVDRLRNKLIRRRAITIARTETMRASNAGQRATWKAMIDQGLLDPETFKQVWVVTDDDRLCELCAPMDGVTASIDETFVSSEKGVLPSGRVAHDGPEVDEPPLHVACRCTLSAGFDD